MVTNLVKGSENTGVGGVWNNKGGQAISFTLNQTTSLCFVNSHLAAHEGQVRHRQDRPDVHMRQVGAQALRSALARTPTSSP